MEVTVGKFAKMVNTTIRTLRYYEKMDLLVPKWRNDYNQKIYTRAELKRFYNIQLLKSMGWSLNEIKQMLEQDHSFRDMIDLQEAVLLDKRKKINQSLAIISRMKHITSETDDLSQDDFMLLMNTIRLEEDQRMILQQYFSLHTVEKLMPKNKQQQLTLDKLNKKLLLLFHEAINNKLRPDDPEIQQELKNLLAMLPAPLAENSPSVLDMEHQMEVFKALLPTDMTEFLSEAIHVLYSQSSSVKGEQK